LRRLSNEDTDRMLAAQMPAERKRPRSEFVIENDGTLAELEPRARFVFEALRERAARAAWRDIPGPVALVADSPKDADGWTLAALGSAFGAAGVTAYRITGKAPTVLKALQSVPPRTIVATAAAVAAALQAARKLESSPQLRELGTPAAGAAAFDLRPWGGGFVALSDKTL
jgi:hypothetical protein